MSFLRAERVLFGRAQPIRGNNGNKKYPIFRVNCSKTVRAVFYPLRNREKACGRNFKSPLPSFTLWYQLFFRKPLHLKLSNFFNERFYGDERKRSSGKKSVVKLWKRLILKIRWQLDLKGISFKTLPFDPCHSRFLCKPVCDQAQTKWRGSPQISRIT